MLGAPGFVVTNIYDVDDVVFMLLYKIYCLNKWDTHAKGELNQIKEGILQYK